MTNPEPDLLEQVVTISEASEKWQHCFKNRKAAADAIRHACQPGKRQRFKKGEARKSGREWIILVRAMIRLYGEPMI